MHSMCPFPAPPLPNKLASIGSYLVATWRGGDHDISIVGKG